MLRTRKQKTSFALLLGSVLGLVGGLLSISPLGLILEEDIGLDWHFILRGIRTPPNDAVIVSIDKESAHALKLAKEPIKWPRALFAQAIDRLSAHGARAIGIDIHFKEQKSATENQILANAFIQAKNVILFTYLDKIMLSSNTDTNYISTARIEKLVPPIPILAKSALALAPFPLPKVPAKVSQYWTFKQSIGGIPTFPIVMCQLHMLSIYDELYSIINQVSPTTAILLPDSKEKIIRNKLLNQTIITLRGAFEQNTELADIVLKRITATPAFASSELSTLVALYQSGNSEYLNYYGPARTVNTIPFYKVLSLDPKPEANQRDINILGKSIFIGLSEPIQLERVDNFFTPFSRYDGIDLSGIEIAATAFNNLANNQTLKQIPMPWFFGLLLIWGLVLGIVGRVWNNTIAIFGTALLSLFYFAVSFSLFNLKSIWLPYVVPIFVQMPMSLFASILWNYLDANKERTKLRHAFGFYLPDRILDEISDNFAIGKDSNQVVYGTCLSTDAESYTALSENLSPSELGKLMNQYFNTLFLPIKQNKGIVCDIIGDEMMAVWTSPIAEDEQRRYACDATLKIMQRVADFNINHPQTPFPTRAGLHSGEILLGNVGALNHFEYRPVGDIVNTASRIQGLNKYLNTQILATKQAVTNVNEQPTRYLGKFLLAGKSTALEIYELLTLNSEKHLLLIQYNEEFNSALSAFQNSKWDSAAQGFKSILEHVAEDGPSQFYLSLCDLYRTSPPQNPWDGTVRIRHK